MNSQSFNKEFESAKEDLDSRLASKHIRTLNCLQEKSLENDKLRHRVSALEGYKMKADYYAALEQQVNSLQDELSKCDHLHSLGRNVEEKINEVKEEYRTMFYEYQQVMEKKYSREVKKYKDEREQLAQAWEQEKAKMREIEEELKTSNKNLQKKLEAQDVMEKDMNNLVEELDRTVASFEEIKSKNEELQESENSLKDLCKDFEEENISLQEELDDSSYRKKKLKKDMNKMIMKITKYIKQIKELEQVKNSASRIEFENGWLKHLHEKSTAELKSLKMKHKDALNELQVITQERNFLRSELSSVQHEMSKLKKELEGSKCSFGEFLELKKQVEVLEDENKSLVKKSKTYKIKMLKPAECSSADSQKQLVPINVKSR
ncbi:Hypothetical predicted protein [Paramuricea clavata]|uniref:Uncharacterized protein n=1 Tax=Paramuricea clavata TaxID=317549 RepID=A0A6S7JK52_PARCT|nr:Hypothetical predicted protein [Paramuricea clavata]